MYVMKTHWYNMCRISIHQLLTKPNEVIITPTDYILSFFEFWTCGLRLFNYYQFNCRIRVYFNIKQLDD